MAKTSLTSVGHAAGSSDIDSLTTLAYTPPGPQRLAGSSGVPHAYTSLLKRRPL
jgi:hypothetical protein